MKLKNSSVDDFLENVNSRKIIFFGKGIMIHSMINTYENFDWKKNVMCIVDNDKYLWGSREKIKGYDIPVESPDIFKGNLENIVIVITSVRYFEIIEQLDKISELKNTECYMYALMQTYSDNDTEKFRTATDIQMIPKKIHYCWFGGNKLNDLSEKCIDSWRKLCPDFEIIQWNESNYDVNKNAYVKEAYENKAYAFVSDYARLDILYENGGIYMDTDVEVLKDLTPLLYNRGYCSFSNHVPRIATGLGMGAVKGLPILKDMMEIYKYERYITDYGVNKTLCQLYNTKVLVYHGLVQNGRYQIVKDMTCYPKEYFDPKSSHLGIMPDIKKAFSIHHSANTWSGKTDERFKNVKDASKEQIEVVLERIQNGGYPIQ